MAGRPARAAVWAGPAGRPAPRPARPCRLAALLLLLAAATGPALAHDTWLAPRPGAAAGQWRFNLGTGERFPQMQTSVGADPAPQAGCRSPGEARERPLWIERDTPSALVLAGDAAGEHSADTCHARMPPHELNLDAATVKLYHDEVRAPASVREAWARQHAQGLRWAERYTKSARHERFAAGQAEPPAAALGLDIRPLRPVLRAGDTLEIELRLHGQPLPGQALQLVGGDSPAAFWLQTDAAGRARVPLPLPGRWMVRATHLQPRPDVPGGWDSQFGTLSFEIRP